MFRKIRIAALSAVLGLGTLAAVPATAQADGIYFSFGQSGAQGGVYLGTRGPSYGGHHHDRRHWRAQRVCTPPHAVEKARRMGLRNARVVHVNRNVIHVAGQRHRYHRASIVFSRAPNCPVIRAG